MNPRLSICLCLSLSVSVSHMAANGTNETLAVLRRSGLLWMLLAYRPCKFN